MFDFEPVTPKSIGVCHCAKAWHRCLQFPTTVGSLEVISRGSDPLSDAVVRHSMSSACLKCVCFVVLRWRVWSWRSVVNVSILRPVIWQMCSAWLKLFDGSPSPSSPARSSRMHSPHVLYSPRGAFGCVSSAGETSRSIFKRSAHTPPVFWAGVRLHKHTFQGENETQTSNSM